MKKETEELIKLISSAEDSDRALLTAFAILVEYLEKREDAKKGDLFCLHRHTYHS